MTSFDLSNASPQAREGFFHALRLHAAGKDERRTYQGVQLATVGDWPTGGQAQRKPFTRETFEAILASADDAVPTVGISHKAPEANGQNGTPSLAPIKNVSIGKDPKTGKDALYGDIIGLPVWAAEEYPRRSVELMVYPDGRTVLSRLALLGDEAAAIPDLAPMPEGAQLIAAAAVIGTIADTTSPIGDNQPSPTGPDTTEEQEPTMTVDTTALRQSLPDLPADADDATVLAEAAKALAAKSGGAETAPAESAATTPAAAPTTTPVETPPELVAAAADDGVVKVEAAAFEALKADAAAGRAARDEQVAERRMTLVTAAADEGKYLADRIPHFVKLHEADPEGTEALIASLAPGVAVPVGQMVGHSVTAAASTSVDDAYAAFYGDDDDQEG